MKSTRTFGTLLVSVLVLLVILIPLYRGAAQMPPGIVAYHVTYDVADGQPAAFMIPSLACPQWRTRAVGAAPYAVIVNDSMLPGQYQRLDTALRRAVDLLAEDALRRIFVMATWRVECPDTVIIEPPPPPPPPPPDTTLPDTIAWLDPGDGDTITVSTIMLRMRSPTQPLWRVVGVGGWHAAQVTEELDEWVTTVTLPLTVDDGDYILEMAVAGEIRRITITLDRTGPPPPDAPLDSIWILPPAFTVAVNDSVRLCAVGLFADGRSAPPFPGPVTWDWSSEDGTVMRYSDVTPPGASCVWLVAVECPACGPTGLIRYDGTRLAAVP